jgi:hypothetical protein
MRVGSRVLSIKRGDFIKVLESGKPPMHWKSTAHLEKVFLRAHPSA